jgi:hypothetical protein
LSWTAAIDGRSAGLIERCVALGDAEREYHQEALEDLGEEYDPNRPPNIAFIEAKLAAFARKWAPKARPTRCRPRVIAAFRRRLQRRAALTRKGPAG